MFGNVLKIAATFHGLSTTRKHYKSDKYFQYINLMQNFERYLCNKSLVCIVTPLSSLLPPAPPPSLPLRVCIKFVINRTCTSSICLIAYDAGVNTHKSQTQIYSYDYYAFHIPESNTKFRNPFNNIDA